MKYPLLKRLYPKLVEGMTDDGLVKDVARSMTGIGMRARI